MEAKDRDQKSSKEAFKRHFDEAKVNSKNMDGTRTDKRQLFLAVVKLNMGVTNDWVE